MLYDDMIKYSEYLAEEIDRNRKYSNYIAEQIGCNIKYRDSDEVKLREAKNKTPLSFTDFIKKENKI